MAVRLCDQCIGLSGIAGEVMRAVRLPAAENSRPSPADRDARTRTRDQLTTKIWPIKPLFRRLSRLNSENVGSIMAVTGSGANAEKSKTYEVKSA